MCPNVNDTSYLGFDDDALAELLSSPDWHVSTAQSSGATTATVRELLELRREVDAKIRSECHDAATYRVEQLVVALRDYRETIEFLRDEGLLPSGTPSTTMHRKLNSALVEATAVTEGQWLTISQEPYFIAANI